MNEKTERSPEPAAGSSTASSTGNDGLFADGGGPVFDPAAAPPEPEPTATVEIAVPDWDVSMVRRLLTTQGLLLHGVVAVDKDSQEWVYTEADLGAIAPPLTSILNRYDATRAMAGTSDELMVAIGFGSYTIRSWGQRRAALARLAHDDTDTEPGEAVVSDPDVATEPTVVEVETPPIRPRR